MQVRDLLTHTSGLTYDFMADNPVAQAYRDARIMNDATRSLEAVIDELATLPLAFQPGSRWHYSVGIDVAARLIEVISGQPLGEFLRERLFDPLGMTDTGFGVPDAKLDRLVRDVRPARPHRRELLGRSRSSRPRSAGSTSASTSRPPTRPTHRTSSSAVGSACSRRPTTT